MFRTIFVEAPVGMALVNSETGKIYEVNPKFAHIAGRTTETIVDLDWMSITHPEDLQTDLDNMALLNAGKINSFNMQKRYIKPDNSIVWINMTIAKTKADKFGNPCHVCMIEDITQSKQAEEELKNSREELKRYASHLQNIREEERILLAREIHDDLAQNLVVVKVDLGLLKMKLLRDVGDADDSDLMDNLTEISTKMNNTISTCRKIMSGLRSEELELIGLLETMKQYTVDFQEKYRIECKFQTSLETISLAPKEAVTMLRIFQEALSNVYKHANASAVKILLRIENEQLICEIEDDGVGFSIEEKTKKLFLWNHWDERKSAVVKWEVGYSKRNE